MAVRFNEDQDMVKKIQEGLKRKGGYCPCKLPVIPENKCICQDFVSRLQTRNSKGIATADCIIKVKTEQSKRIDQQDHTLFNREYSRR